MKLESTLKFRPAVLLLAPLVDVFGILLVYFLLGSSLVLQSGVRLELPPSSFALQGFSEGHVLVLPAGSDSRILVDDQEVTLAELGARLDAIARQDRKSAGRVSGMLLKADRMTSHGLVMAVADAALARGFRVAIASQPREGE